MSHPAWVRGLKLEGFKKGAKWLESHPAWVRGLKQGRCGRGESW